VLEYSDYTIALTFPTDENDDRDDQLRQDAYDRCDAAFARLAVELWDEFGTLLVAVDDCAEVDVTDVAVLR
jgi:hypothetical protein